MKIVAISGSLRTGSSNTSLLQAVAGAMPDGATMTLFEGLAELPAFNPDFDVDGTPEVVTRWRALIRDADAVAISSPEYARGVVGSLKNALDWLVGSGELYLKPIALLHVSTRGEVAQTALRTTLNVMTGAIVFEEIVPLDTVADAARRIVRAVKARKELPRAILFDLDETIITFGHRPSLLREAAEHYAAKIAPVTPAELADQGEADFRDFWGDEDRHKAWRQRLPEARRLILSQTFAKFAHRAPALTEALAHEFADHFHAYREAQIRFFPDAVETVDELRRRGVKLTLITNGASEIQRAKIERFDLLRRFDHIQIESEHPFGKPELDAYRHAMATLGVTADECWIVGDNLEWEVAAPQRLGIYAVWHDPWGEGLPPGSPVRPDRIIRALSELLPPEF
ncbi:MAG TPA: HAD-IA family hydrolase [Rhizomicrobium sp.]|nr:HAD-IA family hydrolase [Rhizomicrobium sp.]